MIINPKNSETSEILAFLNKAFEKTNNEFKAYASETGICIEDKTGNKTSTFILPVQEERMVTANRSETELEILLYNAGVFTDTVRTKSTQIYSAKKLVSLFGVKAFSHFEKNDWENLFYITRSLLSEVPHSIVYSTLGWTNDNSSFLYGNIKVTPTEAVVVKSSLVHQSHNTSEISTNDACKLIVHIIDNLCKDRFVSYTLLSYYALSLLKSRLYKEAKFCPSFALALIGESGTGKTSTVKPMMNPLALETSSFEDSMASIRRTFKANNNGCTIIDDFKCSDIASTEKFEEVVRLSGDITSNGKRVGDTTLTTGMAIFTGEETPKLQASSFPRLLLIELDKDSIDFKVLSSLTDALDKYVDFICSFIQFIMCQHNFIESLVSEVKSKRNDIISSSQQQMHPRYYEMYSWLSVMWKYLKSFFASNNIELTFDYDSALLEHIVNQSDKFNFDPIGLFSRTFFELKEANSFKVVDYNAMKGGECFDVMETSDELFLKSGVVYDKIVSHLKKSNITFPYTERRLRRELYAKKILNKRHEDKLTTEKKDSENHSTTGILLLKNSFKKQGGYYHE